MFRKLIISTVAAVGTLVGAVQAATLSSTFVMDIYTFDAGGVSSNADATAANLVGKALTANVTYTGALDFLTTGSATLVSDFLDSGTGSYVVNSGSVAGLMTGSGFRTTSLFDIRSSTVGAGSGVILHDDGITLYEGASIIAASPAPTASGNTPYVFGGTGEFRLIYSAANGNPERLNVSFSPVPVPAAGLLLIGALGGLAAMNRRKKAS